MTIQIQFIKIPASEALTAKTEELTKKLGARFEWVESLSISFEEAKGNTDDNKICKIELTAPTPRIFISVNDYNYEAALKVALNDMERQLIKRKTKTFSK